VPRLFAVSGQERTAVRHYLPIPAGLRPTPRRVLASAGSAAEERTAVRHDLSIPAELRPTPRRVLASAGSAAKERTAVRHYQSLAEANHPAVNYG